MGVARAAYRRAARGVSSALHLSDRSKAAAERQKVAAAVRAVAEARAAAAANPWRRRAAAELQAKAEKEMRATVAVQAHARGWRARKQAAHTKAVARAAMRRTIAGSGGLALSDEAMERLQGALDFTQSAISARSKCPPWQGPGSPPPHVQCAPGGIGRLDTARAKGAGDRASRLLKGCRFRGLDHTGHPRAQHRHRQPRVTPPPPYGREEGRGCAAGGRVQSAG